MFAKLYPRFARASTAIKRKYFKQITRFFAFFLTLACILGGHYFPTMVNAATPMPTPLSTQGGQILDATGQAVLLRGVNWFGMETDTRTPHGLWVRDYQSMLAQIKELGYNIIRLPYSVQGLRSNNISGVNFGIGRNQNLQGKTPLQVMDIIIKEAERQGLLILLDSHRLNDSRIPELWYGDGFTEQDWIDTWTMLAQRYKDQKNVIGADLKNEPHGPASWGTGDRNTDWRLAAERAGNAILAVNPDWLIVVEGVEKNVPGQQLNHWWGGNLEGVKNYPVRLSKPNKLVYSPHEYGAGVYNQPWFNDPAFPSNLRQRWEIGFQYISEEGIAPILIGEFGGRQVDASSKEGIWQRELVKYIDEKELHFTYWSWNPNSGDTGGILKDDWTSIHQDKQALLDPLLGDTVVSETSPSPSPEPSPEPSPSPSPEPSPSPSPEPSPNEDLVLNSNIDSDWNTGFCIKMKVTNSTNSPSSPWQLRFQMNDAEIRNSWNGDFQQQGSNYTVTPPSWGRILPKCRQNAPIRIFDLMGDEWRPTKNYKSSHLV